MTLTENLSLGGWTGEALYRGGRIEVNIDAEMWEVGPQAAGESALESIERRWPEIESALLGQPLKLYNESWADLAQGFPALTAPQFLEKLSLTSISVGQECISLYFADGDLFAGHIVSVTLIGDQKPTTMIEG